MDAIHQNEGIPYQVFIDHEREEVNQERREQLVKIVTYRQKCNGWQRQQLRVYLRCSAFSYQLQIRVGVRMGGGQS